jgi:hypothetical protein
MNIKPLPHLHQRVVDRTNSPLTFIDEDKHRLMKVIEYSAPLAADDLYLDIERALKAWISHALGGSLNGWMIFHRKPMVISRKIVEKRGAWGGISQDFLLDGVFDSKGSVMDSNVERGIWGVGHISTINREFAHFMRYMNGLIVIPEKDVDPEDLKSVAFEAQQGRNSDQLYNSVLWSTARGWRSLWLCTWFDSDVILYEASRRLN